jgi:polar amino acid transport system substrate-binding protein
MNEQVGGLPTRFTFEGLTPEEGKISSLQIAFPARFDLTEARVDALTLVGLQRVPITPQVTVQGQKVSLAFTEPIDPTSTLRVQIFDVVTPVQGGVYPVEVTYGTAEGAQGEIKGLQVQYLTPTRSELISRALDEQGWVQTFNSVKFFSLFFKPQLIILSIPLLFTGWLLSIALVLFAFPAAIIGGLLLAFAKMSKIAPLRWVAGAYVNVIRGTPLFLQMFVAFIGLPIAGIHLSPYPTAIIVLALNSAAYLTEIFRAGIQSIHKGQFEAASSLGMSYAQSMRYVIIPQTVKRVLPTMTSEFILLFKDTALLSALGVIELMYRANSIVSRTGNLTPFVVSAVYYLLVTIPLINWVGRLEQRLAIAEGGQSAKEAKERHGFWRGLSRTVDPYRAEAADEINSDEKAGR